MRAASILGLTLALAVFAAVIIQVDTIRTTLLAGTSGIHSDFSNWVVVLLGLAGIALVVGAVVAAFKFAFDD